MRPARTPCALLFLLFSTPCFAAAFDPTTFVSATDKLAEDLGAFVGLGGDLHAYEGAVPQSTLKGIDVGGSITAIALPGSVVSALTDLGIPDVPHYIPIPKINIQKALPARLMVGSEFIPNIKFAGRTFTMYGFDLQWTAIDRPRLPAIAIRGQFNYNDFVFIQSATYGGDVLATYKLPLVDTYAGAGYRLVKAKINVPASAIAPPDGINLNPTIDAAHFVAGATMRMGFGRVTAEADLTTRGVNTYGTKISVFF
jgi:hypothetical protein